MENKRGKHGKGERLACMQTLVLVVTQMFPRMMNSVLKEHVGPRWLHIKYSRGDFHFVLTKNERDLMKKLPNMDDFTVELCYKILRYEVEIDEPTCKWGNTPHDTEVKLSDDIQRILNATNDIASVQDDTMDKNFIKPYIEKLEKLIIRMNRNYPRSDFLGHFNYIVKSDSYSRVLLRELTRIKTITVTPPIHQMVTASEQKVYYSRISVVIIDIFPKILRNIIGKIIPAYIIYQQCSQILSSFYPDQQCSLFELQKTNTYDSVDIPIIYRLLRHFSLIQKPTKGWGNFPDLTDVNIADDVERIRILRNEIAHRHNTNIEEQLFKKYFEEFRNICHRIDKYFHSATGYEQSIIDCKTLSMDIQMKNKYENALKELENMKMRIESKPVRFYWGDTFETSINSLRIMLKDQKLQGKTKIHVQIVFQKESDIDKNVAMLNLLKDEINEGLTGIEFIVASQGSIVLQVTLSIDVIETDELLKSSLTLFFGKILDIIDYSSAEIVDVVLILDEAKITELQSKITYENKFHYSAPIYLDFNIDAELFETDEQMKEQFKNISKTIFQYSNGGGPKCDISASILPLSLDHLLTTNESYPQAQTPVTYNVPISVSLRKQIYISSRTKECQSIEDCIKIGNKLVFTDSEHNQLIICSVDGTDFHCIPLPHTPRYITEINKRNVAVSCSERCILIINISLYCVSDTVNISGHCWEISYNDNTMYVVISRRLQVIDTTGKVKRTIPLPSNDILYITVHRNKLICIDRTSIYCCYLDGTLIWKFENARYQSLQRLAMDNEGNVYVTDLVSNSVVVVFDDGEHCRQILSETDGLYRPSGIHYDKKENSLLVINRLNGKAFILDVMKKTDRGGT